MERHPRYLRAMDRLADEAVESPAKANEPKVSVEASKRNADDDMSGADKKARRMESSSSSVKASASAVKRSASFTPEGDRIA